MTRRLAPAFAAAAAAALLAGASPARPGSAPAPEALEAQILEVRALVREKRYPIALESLRLIARSIQELRLEEVRPAFPAAPPGWTAGELVSLAAEQEPWSRRIEARREYRRLDGTARISMTLDLHSPWIPTVSLSLNPLYVAGDGLARLVEVSGEKARLGFAPDSGDGDLRVILDGKVLVTLAGRGLASGETLVDLARAIDFDLLRTRDGR